MVENCPRTEFPPDLEERLPHETEGNRYGHAQVGVCDVHLRDNPASPGLTAG